MKPVIGILMRSPLIVRQSPIPSLPNPTFLPIIPPTSLHVPAPQLCFRVKAKSKKKKSNASEYLIGGQRSEMLFGLYESINNYYSPVIKPLGKGVRKEELVVLVCERRSRCVLNSDLPHTHTHTDPQYWKEKLYWSVCVGRWYQFWDGAWGLVL